MPTSKKVRKQFGDKFAEHLVTADHNVLDKYDREFSFHAVCHPVVSDDGTPKLPDDIREFLENNSKEYEIQMRGMHIHAHVKLSEQTLGIDETEELEATTQD